jgi:histidinol phosphatase-like enzyme
VKFQKADSFFDRDGIIKTEISFFRGPVESRPIRISVDDVFESYEHGVRVFISTSQLRIEQRRFTENGLAVVNRLLRRSLKYPQSILDCTKYCPRRPRNRFPLVKLTPDWHRPRARSFRETATKRHSLLTQSLIVSGRYAVVMAGNGCLTMMHQRGA